MATLIDSVTQILMPKGRGKKGGVGFTPGYNPNRILMTVPAYRQHLTDLYSSRTANDSRTLISDLVNHDPDVSAAVHAYLTISASAEPVVRAFGPDNKIDPVGIELAQQLMAGCNCRCRRGSDGNRT